MFKHWKGPATVLPALLALLLSAGVARADWVYRADEGGWKDTETGLVWVDYMVSVKNTFLSFDYAQKMVSEMNKEGWGGFRDWRLATKAEMLTAVAHRIRDFVPIYGSDKEEPPHYYWWSSDQQGSRAWTVDMNWGDTELCSKRWAYLLAMCVRQGTPEGTIVVSKASVVTSTNGDTDAFTVWLNMEPTQNVTIAIGSDPGDKATVWPTDIVFTQDNWSMPQTVTVTGGSAEGQYAITFLASSEDPAYGGVTRIVSGTNVAGVMTTYVSTDVPKMFPTKGGRTNESTLTVPDSYLVLGLRINISATPSVVAATLVSPSGTDLQVFGPCTVTEAFNGENVNGTWKLLLYTRNDDPISGEQITGWSIDVWHQ